MMVDRDPRRTNLAQLDAHCTGLGRPYNSWIAEASGSLCRDI
jgi:hypothetical protein